jgi:hypothetical protein
LKTNGDLDIAKNVSEDVCYEEGNSGVPEAIINLAQDSGQTGVLSTCIIDLYSCGKYNHYATTNSCFERCLPWVY